MHVPSSSFYPGELILTKQVRPLLNICRDRFFASRNTRSRSPLGASKITVNVSGKNPIAELVIFLSEKKSLFQTVMDRHEARYGQLIDRHVRRGQSVWSFRSARTNQRCPNQCGAGTGREAF